MELTLEGIGKKVGAQSWLYDMSLAPKRDAVTLLSRLRERGTNLGIGLRANNRGHLQAYALAKRMNTGFAGGNLIQEKFVTHFARNEKLPESSTYRPSTFRGSLPAFKPFHP